MCEYQTCDLLIFTIIKNINYFYIFLYQIIYFQIIIVLINIIFIFTYINIINKLLLKNCCLFKILIVFYQIVYFQIIVALIQQWMVPIIAGSLQPFHNMEYFKVLERLLLLAVRNYLLITIE